MENVKDLKKEVEMENVKDLKKEVEILKGTIESLQNQIDNIVTDLEDQGIEVSPIINPILLEKEPTPATLREWEKEIKERLEGS